MYGTRFLKIEKKSLKSCLKRFSLPIGDKDLEPVVLKVVVVCSLGQPHLPGKVQEAEEVGEAAIDVVHELVEDVQPLGLQLLHALGPCGYVARTPVTKIVMKVLTYFFYITNKFFTLGRILPRQKSRKQINNGSSRPKVNTRSY